MRGYLAFLKKEFIESFRTYKLLIVLAVFVMFGISNPLLAKLLPEIMKAVETQGITLSIPEPTALDSWTQFYKNMTGTQIIVLVIVFSGTIATELSKGTLVNILTKGVSRISVIMAKFTAITLIWTLSYWLCYGVTYGYTAYLFSGSQLSNLAFSAFCMWLFGIMIISVIMFFGSLTGNIFGTLLGTGGFAVVLMLLNMISKINDYVPYKLASENLQLIQNQSKIGDLIPAILVAGVVSVVSICCALAIFRKKQL